jgi:hypothetical protein
VNASTRPPFEGDGAGGTPPRVSMPGRSVCSRLSRHRQDTRHDRAHQSSKGQRIAEHAERAEGSAPPSQAPAPPAAGPAIDRYRYGTDAPSSTALFWLVRGYIGTGAPARFERALPPPEGGTERARLGRLFGDHHALAAHRRAMVLWSARPATLVNTSEAWTVTFAPQNAASPTRDIVKACG